LKYDLENVETDVPDEAVKKRWEQESNAIVSDAAKGISNDRARELWNTRASGWKADGGIWAEDLGRKRGVDRVKAGHIAAAADLDTKAGDLAVSQDTFRSSIAGQQAVIKRDAERGILSQEDAARQIAQLDGLAIKDNSIRFSSNIDTLIKDGRVAEAQAFFDANNKDVDPQVRETVKKGLEASKQDYAVVSKADELWSQAKGDIGKFYKLSAKITDAPLREKVEARGNNMRIMADQAENQRQDGLQQQMWAHVVNGGTVASAPASLRGALNPEKLGSIRAYENNRDAAQGMSPAQMAQWKDDSATKRYKLESSFNMTAAQFMSDPATAWPKDMYAAYQQLTPDDMR
ncbi:MAG: hypothetical protein ACRDL7_14995, partial [Gaiellaceae bacterium]